MKTLPRSWPFPESVAAGVDQWAADGLPDRSALSLSVPTKSRPPKPAYPSGLLDAPY